MLSGDKVLFFTKPPSVAQARPIRRQWLVNSSQSVGKPRRDRDPRRDIAYELFKRPEQQRVPVSSTCVLIPRRNISRHDKNLDSVDASRFLKHDEWPYVRQRAISVIAASDIKTSSVFSQLRVQLFNYFTYFTIIIIIYFIINCINATLKLLLSLQLNVF